MCSKKTLKGFLHFGSPLVFLLSILTTGSGCRPPRYPEGVGLSSLMDAPPFYPVGVVSSSLMDAPPPFYPVGVVSHWIGEDVLLLIFDLKFIQQPAIFLHEGFG